jgi:TRAP-type transport system periplasmic protein
MRIGEGSRGSFLISERREREMKVRTMLLVVGCVVASVLVLSLISRPVWAQKPVELKLLSGWGIEHPAPRLMLTPFVERVQKLSGGRLKISWVGPEAVPPFEQLRPVKDGLFDVGFTHPAYHIGEIAVGNGMDLVRGTAKERRDAGLYKMMDEVYRAKANAAFLAGFPDFVGYNIFLKKEIKKADLTGMKIRTTPFYEPLVKALGGASVTVKTPEIYSALEKGVVDGAAHPTFGALDYKWYEVSKYYLRPRYGETVYQLLFNLNSWAKLPKDLQEAFLKAAMEIEVEGRAAYQKRLEGEEAELQRLGMKPIVLTGAEAEKYLTTFYERTWEEVVIKLDPVEGPRFKKLAEALKKN